MAEYVVHAKECPVLCLPNATGGVTHSLQDCACDGSQVLPKLDAALAAFQASADGEKARAENLEQERDESNRMLLKATEDFKGMLALCQTEKARADRAEEQAAFWKDMSQGRDVLLKKADAALAAALKSQSEWAFKAGELEVALAAAQERIVEAQQGRGHLCAGRKFAWIEYGQLICSLCRGSDYALSPPERTAQTEEGEKEGSNLKP